MAIRILIVEDEETISSLLNTALTRAGYKCTVCFDGETAASKAEENRFDLALLDIMLPGLGGFELAGYMKEYEIPVIFLTAKTDVADKVRGLKMEVEDYITKPFHIEELLARVELVLKRRGKIGTTLENCGVVIDEVGRTVTKDGQNVDLTSKEFDILVLFFKNPRVALYKETIYERVWLDEYTGNTRTVDLHVQRLRKKLGLEDHIITVVKIGYRFEP